MRVVRPVVVVVVDAGMLAMTAERISEGETPRFPVAQPVSDTTDTTAIAPTRGSDGVIMSSAEAESTPGHQTPTSGCREMP